MACHTQGHERGQTAAHGGLFHRDLPPREEEYEAGGGGGGAGVSCSSRPTVRGPVLPAPTPERNESKQKPRASPGTVPGLASEWHWAA